MTKDELVKLAARCEAASGPDRELDREIAISLGLQWDYASDWGSRGYDRPVAFPYTASIDAAMTLVPEGVEVVITRCADGSSYAEVGNMRPAATPALALCAAALRARATTTGEAK